MNQEPPAITIRIYPTDQGGYMYDVWDKDVIDEDQEDDAYDGGQCTSTYGNAIEMANDVALKIIRNHFSDNVFNPAICPSSLDENGEPNVDNGDGFETAHKWSDTPEANDDGVLVIKCDECGAEQEPTV